MNDSSVRASWVNDDDCIDDGWFHARPYHPHYHHHHHHQVTCTHGTVINCANAGSTSGLANSLDRAEWLHGVGTGVCCCLKFSSRNKAQWKQCEQAKDINTTHSSTYTHSSNYHPQSPTHQPIHPSHPPEWYCRAIVPTNGCTTSTLFPRKLRVQGRS